MCIAVFPDTRFPILVVIIKSSITEAITEGCCSAVPKKILSTAMVKCLFLKTLQAEELFLRYLILCQEITYLITKIGLVEGLRAIYIWTTRRKVIFMPINLSHY